MTNVKYDLFHDYDNCAPSSIIKSQFQFILLMIIIISHISHYLRLHLSHKINIIIIHIIIEVVLSFSSISLIIP